MLDHSEVDGEKNNISCPLSDLIDLIFFINMLKANHDIHKIEHLYELIIAAKTLLFR